MPSARREKLSQDIKNILEEMSDREKVNRFSGLHIFLWKFTVNFSYALKRFLDILLSSAALIILLPLFIVLGILIKLTSRGPVFFVQVRVGQAQTRTAGTKSIQRRGDLQDEKRPADHLDRTHTAENQHG